MALKLITILTNRSFDEVKITRNLPEGTKVFVDQFDDNTGASFESHTRFDLISGTDVTLDNMEMDGVMKRQTN
ncbi:hypothetical protein GWO43_16055 [candidate division KSB1 bacterium]|nr:hypothetical protein [candidate division KSB1 bacterium]NIV68747.1 hypothetical protein [Phycisphaerae bacterium]NIS25465.1 hypothetical protein [candidate division KSB1 bacterium]NIT72357.1 hypothetical protein [candidate division KSB1 bacterium]NIU26142.1 hypothetical protein [candidate division KSB1 bacterium]